jgi:lysine biosynthesis protein LysW
MIKAQNPITGEDFELPENTEQGEIVTDPSDPEQPFEVISISIEDKVANLQEIQSEEEDWGE